VGAFGQALDDLAEQMFHRAFRSDFQEEVPQGIKLGLIIERQLHLILYTQTREN
jgi:hypothetical protein